MIKHIKCNIFDSGADTILHQVNCQGVMGSGIAKQVRDRYPNVYASYKNLCTAIRDPSILLGTAQFIRIDNCVYIVNLFAQDKYGYDGKQYTDYLALDSCLNQVRIHTLRSNEVIAIPYRMGCDRGGGDWNVVYEMIEKQLGDFNVLICEYNGR